MLYIERDCGPIGRAGRPIRDTEGKSHAHDPGHGLACPARRLRRRRVQQQRRQQCELGANASNAQAPAAPADPQRENEMRECADDVRTELPAGSDLNAFCGCAVDKMQTGLRRARRDGAMRRAAGHPPQQLAALGKPPGVTLGTALPAVPGASPCACLILAASLLLAACAMTGRRRAGRAAGRADPDRRGRRATRRATPGPRSRGSPMSRSISTPISRRGGWPARRRSTSRRRRARRRSSSTPRGWRSSAITGAGGAAAALHARPGRRDARPAADRPDRRGAADRDPLPHRRRTPRRCNG